MRHSAYVVSTLALLTLAGCSQPEAPPPTEQVAPTPGPEMKDGKPVAGPPAPPAGGSQAPAKAGPEIAKLGPKAVTTKSGLQYEDLKVGDGAAAADGKKVSVHYTGWLTDGTKFDSSFDHGSPFDLTLPGQVIPGWNEGIPGMKVGGKRKLLIPPNLGYGDAGQGPIPGGATLVFEIELLKVE